MRQEIWIGAPPGVLDEASTAEKLAYLASQRHEAADLTSAAEAYGKFFRALKTATRATKKKIAVVAVQSNYGYCLQGLERHRQAVEQFEAVVRQKPKQQHVWRALSFSYYELKSWKDMARTAERAVALAPKDDYAWQQLAIARQFMKDIDGAIAANTKSVKANADNAYARYNLAVLLWEHDRGDYLEHFATAFRLAPELKHSARTDADLAPLRAEPAFAVLLGDKKPAKKKTTTSDNEQLNEQLIDACVRGDYTPAMRALKGGADLEYRSDRGGRTALNAACGSDNAKLVGALLAAGAAVDARDKWGNTGLSRLVEENGSPKLVSTLIEHGADVDAENDDGWTPLFFACAFDERNNALVQALLTHKADINRVSKDGWTPLLLACHEGHSEKGPAKILLADRGTEVGFAGVFGWTALMAAARNGEPELLELLIARGADVNTRMGNVTEKRPLARASVLAANIFRSLSVPKGVEGATALTWAKRHHYARYRPGMKARLVDILRAAGAKE